MTEIYFSKLLKNNTTSVDTKNFIYIKSKWDYQQAEISLQDSETGKCYRGLVSKETLNETANDLELPIQVYEAECRRLLTAQMPIAGYSYELDDENKQLKVKKDPLSYLYLDIALKEIKNHYEIFDDVIELIQQQQNYTTERADKTKDNDTLKVEMQDDFRRLIDEKNRLEKSLLKKAALLLNSKKQKITELEQRLKQYEKQAEETIADITHIEESEEDVPGTSNNVQTTKRQARIIESDASSEEEGNENVRKNNSSDDDAFMADTEPIIFPV
uniref:XRCC4 N-terminal domain-containing protein n=1 Tax=Glossina pallidipes TaxID=7398 RepID=A0A1B0A361_GLOPL